MSKAIGVRWNERHFVDDIEREDCEWAAWLFSRYGLQNCGSFWSTVRDLMLAGFCLLFFVGCSSTPKFTVETITPDQFTVTVEGFTAKQDDTITAVKANTEAIEKIVVKVQSLEGAILETRKSLEASLQSKSETVQTGQEVITESGDAKASSATESPDKNANDSQPSTGSVAESGDSVPYWDSGDLYLQYWGASWCGPCKTTKPALMSVAAKYGLKVDSKDVDTTSAEDKRKARIGGHGNGIPQILLCRNRKEVDRLIGGQRKQDIDQWLSKYAKPVEFPQTSIEPVPIVPQVAQTTTQDLIAIHNEQHGGGSWSWPGGLAEHLRNTHGVMVDGTGPYYSANQVFGARSSVRSVPYRSGYRIRSNAVSRFSCPTCPR